MGLGIDLGRERSPSGLIGWRGDRGGAVRRAGRIERGRWQLKVIGGATARECACRSARLLQIRHPAPRLHALVIEDAADHVTSIIPARRAAMAAPRSRSRAAPVRLDTQGIADGAPFDAVTRPHVGACAPSPPR